MGSSQTQEFGLDLGGVPPPTQKLVSLELVGAFKLTPIPLL